MSQRYPQSAYRLAQLAARAAAGALSEDAVRRVARAIVEYAARVSDQIATLPVGTPRATRLALERTRSIMLSSSASLNVALQRIVEESRSASFAEIFGIWQETGLQVARTVGVSDVLLGTVRQPPITLMGAYESLGGGAVTWRSRLTGHVAATAADLDGIVRTALMEGAHPEVLARRLRPYVAGAEEFHRAFPKSDDAFARLHDLRAQKGHERDAARKVQANARRIAYSETHNARREAELTHFAVDPLVDGVDWTLAANRGKVDIPDECDAFALVVWYEGRPPGWHRLDAVPVPPHPHDRCEVVPVTRPVAEAGNPKSMPTRTQDPATIEIPGEYLGVTDAQMARIRRNVAANFAGVEELEVGARMRELMASASEQGRALASQVRRPPPA